MNNHDMEACLGYFKCRNVYRKLFDKMWEKYASLGHFGGTVVLSKLSAEEKAQLGGFIQKDYTENKTITISMTALQKALDGSRFSGLSWEEILRDYYGRELVIKKEAKQDELLKKQNYFNEIAENYAGERGREWLCRTLEEKRGGYQVLQQQYGQDKEGLREILRFLFLAVESLPVFGQKTQRLPVFAAGITGNPHFFDDKAVGGSLLLYFIQDFFGKDEIGETRPEKRNNLLYKAGILNDDLSNYVLVYGIHGERRDSSLHDGIEGYYREKEPMQLTLLTLQKLKRAWGNARIYVVENPAVFSMLIESDPEITAVCTNGQLRLSTLLLMDMLGRNGVFYYAGDFDPEGLLIAQNLKNRYGERLYLWNYEKEYYEKAVSGVVLNEKRLKKLEKVELKELQEIKTAIQSERRAGYQENMRWEFL